MIIALTRKAGKRAGACRSSSASRATWKENLPFLPDGDYTLSATVAAPARDTRAGAMQYLLAA
jgi:hypothetical protein